MRAQTATEFLVICAVLLVIAGVVVLIIVGIPQDTQLIQKKQDNAAWFNAPLGIHSFVVNSTAGTITIKNNLRDDLNITQVWLNEQEYTIENVSFSTGEVNQLVFNTTEEFIDVDVVFGVQSDFYTGNISLTGVSYHVGVKEGDLTLLENITYITSAFMVQNQTGAAVASFDAVGNLILRGDCTVDFDCTTPSDGSLIFQNASGEVIAWINASGDMCIEDISCNQFQNCSGDPGDGAFIVKNVSGTTVAYVNNTGGLCIVGRLREDADPSFGEPVTPP